MGHKFGVILGPAASIWRDGGHLTIWAYLPICDYLTIWAYLALSGSLWLYLADKDGRDSEQCQRHMKRQRGGETHKLNWRECNVFLSSTPQLAPRKATRITYLATPEEELALVPCLGNMDSISSNLARTCAGTDGPPFRKGEGGQPPICPGVCSLELPSKCKL